MDARIQEGLDIIQTMWYGIAIRIVNLAIEVYHLDEAQATALKDVYLRQGDYQVELEQWP